jgi:hypothetical protein
MGTPVRRQQAVDQCLKPVGFLDDDLGIFAQLFQVPFRQFQLEQLGGAADATQRIFDLMREVAYQFLVGLALVDQAFFPVKLELLDIFAQLEQQSR